MKSVRDLDLNLVQLHVTGRLRSSRMRVDRASAPNHILTNQRAIEGFPSSGAWPPVIHGPEVARCMT